MALTTRQGRLPRPPSSRCPGSRLPHGLPVLLSGARRPPRPGRLHLRLGGPARPDCSTSSSTRTGSPAIIVEPVLGEGGYIVPPPGFLPRLREITAQHGILLIADEVQTGFGRTGELFAVRHWDVEPDILVMAKGIASGLPLSGHPGPARADGALEARHPRRHVRRQRRVVRGGQRDARRHRGRGPRRQRARARGPVPGRAARAARRATASIGDARGLGLMVAIELVKPDEGDGRVPDPDLTKRIQAEALARKLIVLTAGHLRERHPDHPAAGHDGRRGRPGAGDPRRVPGGRRRVGRPETRWRSIRRSSKPRHGSGSTPSWRPAPTSASRTCDRRPCPAQRPTGRGRVRRPAAGGAGRRARPHRRRSRGPTGGAGPGPASRSAPISSGRPSSASTGACPTARRGPGRGGASPSRTR